MKKFTRTGKKVLSVFLAALMVMTAWVFVAPEKAEAANGSYWLNVKVDVTNKADAKKNIQDSYWTITYRPNNGRGNEATMKYDLKENEYGVLSNQSNNQYMHVSVPGFPTKIYYYHDATWDDKVHYTVKEIYISSSNTSGGVSVSKPNKAIKSGGWGNSEVDGNFSWDEGSKYPYVATSKSISTVTAASNIGIPPIGDKKDVSTSTTTMQYYTTDQYGVRYEPTSYTFSGVAGLTTSGSIGNAYSATATNSTTVSSSSTYQTETVKLNWKNSNSSNTSQHGDSTYTFKVYNPRYKVTYNGNGGTLGTNYTYAYLNQKVSADTSTATSNNVAGLTAEKFPTTGIREGYTFNGIWSAASGGTQYSADTKVTKNSTAYAHWTPIKYNAEFKGNRATYPAAVQEYLIANVATDFDSRPVAPTNVEEYDEGDYHYTFNGKWKNSAGNVYEASSLPIMTTAGARYKAQYNGTFVQADYSGVTAQKNEAARIKSNPNYEAIYTQSSRDNLQAALDAVVTGKGRTQQDVVDGYAQRIKDAIEALEGQKYSVVFMDGRDNSIIKFSYPNVFGDAIQYPANPSMSYDKNYHYTFSKWEGTAQETNLSTVEKNITIVARFNKAEHNFTEEHVDSTCVKQGGTKYTCATCGYSYTTYSGSYGEHTWSTEWTTDIEPTCTQPGSKSHHCTLCTATKDETVIPALGHDYTGVEPEVIVPVSCDTIGVSIRECTRCGYNDYITTNPIGHKMKDEVTAPTCTSKGYTTSTCEVCGKMLIGSFTDPIAHNYVKKDSECVAPSCIGVGYDVSYCSVCGLKKYDIISAKGHSWNKEQTVDIEPTCTTKGQKSIHCSVCNVISTDTIEEIPAKGHSYDTGEVLALATCTQDGVKAYHCTVSGCGHTKTESIAKLGHSWNPEATVDVEPSCISAGQQSTHCSRCNEVKDITVIPALKHDLTTTTTTATCTVGSKKIEKCSRCDYEKTTIISEALGHNFVAGTPVAATCKSSGYIPYTCSRNCGVAGYNVINGGASKNHNWNITSTVSHGTTTVTGSCSVCGATFSETVNSAHDFKNIKSQTPATCKEVGSLVLACADQNCNETFTVTLAKNENAHKSVTNALTKASCTEAGKVVSICDDCKKVLATTEIPANGHSFTEQTEYETSTCQTKGHITFKCANCTEKKTVELDVNPDAHKFENPVHHNATCSTPAYDEYTCAYGCGKTYKSFTGTADTAAHNWTFSTSQSGTTLTVTCECTICHTKHSQTVEVAEGHTYTNVEVTTQPTCSAEGTIKIACNKQHNSSCTSSVTATLPVNPNAHKIKTIVTAATCTVEGTAYSYCELCKKTIGETVKIGTLGHNYVGGEESVITAATCEADGVKTVQCTRCTNTMETVIPKTGHKWDGGTPHAADCTHGAYTTYKCSTCQKTYDAVVNGAKALGHDWGDWVIVNPTNDKAGSATRTCKRCNETEKVEIKEQGHTFDKAVYTEIPATCTAKGSRTYTCTAHTNCGVSVTVDTDLAQHSYNDGVRTEATCTERAYTTYTCTGCGRVRVVFDDTDAGKPTEHNYVYGESTAACEAGGTVEVTCSKCGDVQTNVPVPALGHDFSKEQTVVDATCHSVGYTVYKCSRCDKTKTEYKNELVAHNWSNWKVTKEPTETMNGEQERHCTNKGCTETETAPIPATIHNWVEQPELATAATCTKAATKTYYCSGCSVCTDKEHIENNAHYVESVGVPLQHSVKVDYNAPTCTENGSYRAYCDRCNEVEFVNEIIPPTGHNFNTRTDYQAPTCSAEGFVEFSCDCGETKKETLETVPSAHSWELKEIVAATCKAAGYKVYVCKHDNTHTYKEFLSDPVKHTEGEWVTKRAATCCSNGYKVLECKDCGAIMDTKDIPATNEHNFVEVKSDNAEPTCTESSYSYKKCSDCGKLDETSLAVKDALGHDFSVFVEKQDATATDNGYVLYKCSRCNETLRSVIPASGHSYTSKVTKEATCTEKGERTYTCTVEGHNDSYTEEIPALGHKAGDVEITPATCLAEGSAVVECTVCNAVLHNKTLAKLPHTFNDTHKKVVPATCQTTGSITYTCATEGCTATLVTTLEKTPHDYKLVKNVAPTCLDSGYDVYACSAEGCTASYNVVTRSANGHSFVEDTARTVQPTCSTVGHKYFKCSVCNAEGYDYEVPATGKHTYNETVKVEPTCESAGYTYNKCTDCDAVDKDSVKAIDPLGHDYSVDEDNGVVKCSRCDSRITVEKVITDEDGTHAFEGKITKQSTCKEQGTIEYTCRTHKNCAKNHTEALPLAKHSATADSIVKTEPHCNAGGSLTDGSIVVKCSVCGRQIGDTVVLPAAHKYTVVKVERATCGSKGKVTERCSVCGHEKVTELEMNASAHEFNSLPSIKVDPTCTTDGYEVYNCKHCDAQKFVKTGEKLNHQHTESVTKNATCTSEGYTRITCKDCGKIISETVIEKTAHVKMVVKVDATCTEKGSTTVVCSVCNTILKETEYTPALGHKWGEWEVISGGNCKVEGKRQRKCTVCGETETISTGIGEHVYPEEGVVTPPTCTTDGFTTYTCTVCHNHSIIKDYTPKLGHKYSSDYRIVREPTCHSTGSKAHYCVNCNAIEPEYNEAYVEIPKLAHTYGEWTVIVEPTCENTGIKERICVNEGCAAKDEGHVETAVVGRLGHHYGDWTVVKEPTCVENGTKQRICDRCNGVETEAVAMTKHTRVADPEVPATCVKTGLTAGSHCSVCGKVFVAQKEIPMISHMDLGGDGKCDTCGKVMTDKTGTDTCFCHGTGFRALVYRFVRLIWKLFKVNQYCTCGAKHW